MKRTAGYWIAGSCAGAVTGLFGAGGGMVLVPLLACLVKLEDRQVFSVSVSVILPICIVSLLTAAATTHIPWGQAWPYLAGGSLGGIAAGIWGQRIPVKWLHRILGIMILWGGVRYLC